MSFFFGRSVSRPNNPKPQSEQKPKWIDLQTFELGSHQVENQFKELIILPYFRSTVSCVCILDDDRRIVTGDDSGNLIVWDIENGMKLAELKYHSSSINGILNFPQAYSSKLEKYQDVIIASSNDKSLTVWNIDTYKRINTLRLSPVPSAGTSNKLLLKCSELEQQANESYFLIGGLDLKLFDLDLNLVDELARKTKENSARLATMIKSDKFVVASNSDIEIYALVCLGGARSNGDDDDDDDEGGRHRRTSSYTSVRMKELKKYMNAHEDSILCLDKVTESMFASGSSNGHFILWQSDTLIKIMDLRPCDELSQQIDPDKRLGLTSITSFQCLYERYILICCGCHIAIYDILSNDFSYKVFNAHGDSKLTDLLLLSDQIVATSAENASIRIWRFEETEKSEEISTLELRLTLIGECLGHSAAIKSIQTITGNEIVSSAFDNLIIIWKNTNVADIYRNQSINRFLCNYKF